MEVNIVENYKLGVKTSIITIIINVILSGVKIIAGVVGKSSAMLADGIHTLSDVLTTFVVLIGLKVSSKEADERHPYGHEKYEPVFAKLLSIFLAVTGLFIGYEGIRTLRSGNIQTPGKIALVAAVISVITKEGMYWYTAKTAKKIKSLSMEADAWHHRSDALSSVGTFIGIFGARMGLKILDPIAAIIVSVLIIKVGVDLYVQSIRGLVDESADDKTLLKIKDLTFSVKGVKDIKGFKTRIFGSRIYVDIEILVDGGITVKEGHDIAEKVHDLIEKNIDDVKHCMVHVEPALDD
ncbi:MAG: cation transporter [Tissierellia bacterium]|nr:cation transporter [Tissierellia bacterium]